MQNSNIDYLAQNLEVLRALPVAAQEATYQAVMHSLRPGGNCMGPETREAAAAIIDTLREAHEDREAFRYAGPRC